MTAAEDKKRALLIAGLWLMVVLGFIIVIAFGYNSGAGFFDSQLANFWNQGPIACDSRSPCVVFSWRSWEMGAVIWSMAFGIFYLATFNAPNIGMGKLVVLLVVVLGEIPCYLAGRFVLNRSRIDLHVLAVLLATFAFFLADLLLCLFHDKKSHSRRIFFESLLLADIPMVAGSFALWVFLHRYEGIPGHVEAMDTFAAGAISFQLIASNIIFIVCQFDLLAHWWRKHHAHGLAVTTERSVNPNAVVPAVVPKALPSAQPRRKVWRFATRQNLIALVISLFAATISAALLLFTWTQMRPGEIVEFVPVSEMASLTDKFGALGLSADGKTVARSSADQIQIFSTGNGELKQQVAVDSEVYALAFAPDGQMLASAGKGLRVVLRDSKTLDEREILDPAKALTDDQDEILCLEFSSDGTFLAAGTRQGIVKLWNLKTGTKWSLPETGSEEKAAHDGEVWALAFSADGNWLVSGGEGVVLWHIGTLTQGEGTEARALHGQTDSRVLATAVAISSDGNLLAAGMQDSKVFLWDRSGDKAETQPKFPPLEAHKGPVRALRFSNDASFLASVSESPGLIFWNTQTGAAKPPLPMHSKTPKVMTFARTPWILASASPDGTLEVWKGRR